MTGRSRVSHFARHGRSSPVTGICAVLVLAAWAITALAAPAAWAQSPRYTVKMQDFAPAPVIPGPRERWLKDSASGGAAIQPRRLRRRR